MAISESSAIQDVDVIQRFQDACEFGGGGHKFIWKLKPESTILITLHWVFNVSENKFAVRSFRNRRELMLGPPHVAQSTQRPQE
jgi:hypothetical protein